MKKTISPDVLRTLRKPFGTLVPDKDVTKQEISWMLNGAKKIITVGDATTHRLRGFGITPDIAVIDGKERRIERNYGGGGYQAKQMLCNNPAGGISKEAVQVLAQSLESKTRVRVLVTGEEDLLAVPLIAMAPAGSVVVYGQPLEGLVIVKLTAAKQNEARALMDRIMGNSD